MFKKVLLILVVAFAAVSAKVQTAEDIYNKYLDFNLARLEGRPADALDLGEKILPDAAKLSDKARISFYYSLGNLYENDSQSVKAQEYYEKVVAAVPDYYVARRALGYMYAKQAEDLAAKINGTASNNVENQKVIAAYTAMVKKALPHLEKAQACDANEETLSRIKLLYKNIKDTQGLATLNTRLAALSKTCIDLLDDK